MRFASAFALLFLALCLTAQATPSVVYVDQNAPGPLAGPGDNYGWHVETVDTGGSAVVGYGTSLAIDGQGRPHIAYGNYTAGDLKHAWYGDGTWRTEDVDTESTVGLYASLTFDLDGRAHIAYVEWDPNNRVKHAWWDGARWEIETVDAGEGYFWSTSLALAPDGSLHVAYAQGSSYPYHLMHAWRDGQGWHAEALFEASPVAVCLAFDGAGLPCIAYTGYDRLMYCRFDGTSWHTEVVDSYDYPASACSLAFDTADFPHISYDRQMAEHTDLKHAWRDGWAWHSETLAPGGNVGGWSSLAFDAAGLPHISYHDAADGDLMHAWWDGGVWRTEMVDVGADVGYYSSLALDTAGCLHVSYLDLTNGDLKWATTGCARTAAPIPEPGCQGALFGQPQAGFPGWVWFSIPLDPSDCCDDANCYDPETLLGFTCGGRLWYWDRYAKTSQVYKPPFLRWDLAVGDSYLLYLNAGVQNPSYWGKHPTRGIEVMLGKQGWTWMGKPGSRSLGYPDFMPTVKVMYPSDETGEVRTAAEDRGSDQPWLQWGWSFLDTYLQAPKTMTPYAPFGYNTCFPWLGYRTWVNVGSAVDENDPDQVTLIWP